MSLVSFSEVLPLNCTYFNSPRSTGRGRGVTTFFKKQLNCQQLSLYSYSSSELNIFELVRLHPMLCAVIYRPCPPKYNKDFINDFSDFLAGIMPKYDVIVGDCNIHVCCPSKPLVKDFFNKVFFYKVF